MPEHTGLLLDAEATQGVQFAGAVYACVRVQDGVAENTAVTLQDAPFDVKPVRL